MLLKEALIIHGIRFLGGSTANINACMEHIHAHILAHNLSKKHQAFQMLARLHDGLNVAVQFSGFHGSR